MSYREEYAAAVQTALTRLGYRGDKCENARIIYDYDAKPANFGFGDQYPVKDLLYCTCKAKFRTVPKSIPRTSWLCEHCVAPGRAVVRLTQDELERSRRGRT